MIVYVAVFFGVAPQIGEQMHYRDYKEGNADDSFIQSNSH
jgi:hypothetical protein